MKEQVLNLYYKYKIIIIPACVGAACLIILALVIVPQMMGYFEEKDKINALQNKISGLETKYTDLVNLDGGLLKNDLELALTLLPTDRDVPQAMADLQNLVSGSNLVLTNTSYSSAGKTQGKESFALNVSVTGNIASLRNFLNQLEDGSRIYKVESVSVRFPPQGQLVEAEIPLSVFYEKPITTNVSVDEPISKLSENDQNLLSKLSALAKKLASVPASSSSSIPIGKSDPFN